MKKKWKYEVQNKSCQMQIFTNAQSAIWSTSFTARRKKRAKSLRKVLVNDKGYRVNGIIRKQNVEIKIARKLEIVQNIYYDFSNKRRVTWLNKLHCLITRVG